MKRSTSRPRIPRRLLPRRRVRERQLGIAYLFDLDDERHTARWAPHGERLPSVLVRDGIHHLEVGVRTALHDAAAELHLFVWIVEIHDGQGDARIASRIASLQRPFARAHQELVPVATDPDGHALW